MTGSSPLPSTRGIARPGYSSPHGPRVSVVIPAYNAATTLEETLRSVAAQDYPDFEAIVVDDGSTDATAAIAEAFARSDSRFRLVGKANGGVATARNLGIEEARGEYVAILDSDDLWKPGKLSAQAAIFDASGPEVGMVYSWTLLIDPAGQPLGSYAPRYSGNVMRQICAANIAHNGSTPMFRREALLAVGGFDPGLRAANAEGCEDWQLYCRIAARYEARVVPQFLTLYRVHPHSLSSNVMRMMRSHDLISAELQREFPEHRNALRMHAVKLLMGLLLRTAAARDWAQSRVLLGMMFERHPAFAAFMLAAYPAKQVIRAIQRRTRQAPVAPGGMLGWV
jgi:glycosyltransferase involved in cell wall biosynthesis